MPNAELPEVFAAQVIFWILLPLVLFGPLRWAVLAWLIMGNLDATGPDQSALVAVGWINAAKGIALPLYLWWRLRRITSEVTQTPPARLWLLLTGYATVAILWSPFPLAAAKLVGNMIGVLLTIIILEKAVRKGLLHSGTLGLLILASLGLGIVQTYYYGGISFGFDGADQPIRFSSFIAAQQYAAFLVAFLAVVLWHGGFGWLNRFFLGAALCAALLLNGSRTWVFGAVLVLVVYSWLSSRRLLELVAFSVASITLGVLFIINLTRFDADIISDTSSRIVATLSAVLAGKDTSHNAGLRNLSFRFALYEGVLEDLHIASVREILLGHGTSSGGDIALQVFPTRYDIARLDPNRTIHNEWLRALYEWGVIGLLLLAGVFASLLSGLIIRYRDKAWKARASAVLSFLPAFLTAVSAENVVAGAGNAVTMSFAIILALLWTPVPALSSERRRTIVLAR